MKKAAALIFASAAVLSGELYRYTFCRGSSRLLGVFLDKKGHEEDYYLKRDAAAERLRRQEHEKFYLLSPDGHMLHGFYYPTGARGRRIAFIIHGYRSEHRETAGLYYDYYKSRGFDVFCCDHAAAGESEGHFIGFDVFESRDCLMWLDFLRRRFGEDVQIVLHGFSMGGASVLKMSGYCPGNVKFIVSDSAYADGRELLRGQLGLMFWPMRLINRLISGYELAETQVLQSLSLASAPILFVHGREDKTVPFENGPRLYGLYSGEKDCLFVDGARHVESMYIAPEDYAAKLDGFIQKYII